MENASTQGSQLEPETIDDKSQATVLPVPLALQMVTTEDATDASKEINNSADIVDNGNIEAEDNVQVEDQHEAAEQIETQQENSDNDKSTEKVKEPQPVETEHNEEQGVEAGVEEISNTQGGAEATQVTNAVDVAVVQPVVEETAVEPENGLQSPDYPADAPAISQGEANVEVESSTVTAEKPEHTEQAQPQEDVVNKDTLDTNKAEVLVNNYDEQAALNSGVTTMMEHSDVSASPANVGKPEISVNNVEPQDMDNIESSNPANAPPTVIVDNTSPPANADKLLSCYSCTSTTDAKCAPGPGRAMNCQTIGNKQNGCYTLYKGK